MKKTKHVQARMCQRGIRGEVIDFVLEHGNYSRSKLVVTRQDAEILMRAMKRQQRHGRMREAPPGYRALRTILDKGGVAVVVRGRDIVTAFNVSTGWGVVR